MIVLHIRYFVHPGEYLSSDYGFTLQKDSQLTEIFNFHISKIIESGLLDQLEKKYFNKFTFVNDCAHESSGDIFNTIFCFAQLAVGCVIATVILCIECIGMCFWIKYKGHQRPPKVNDLDNKICYH